MVSPVSRTGRLAWLLACAFLTSCQGTPPLSDAVRAQSSEEVGNVFVAAYPPVPWKDIADKLEPKHNLTTADARALAAVTTQSQTSQFLSTFALGLGLGLPSRTSSSVTTVASDGTATTTSTRKVDPGAIPASSGAAAATIADASLAPDLAKGPFANGIDASTQLMAGTGVYQLAQILDNQITRSVQLKDYQAHLVTFQVNLQPRRRNLPYDAYINLTLMPASWQQVESFSRTGCAPADPVCAKGNELAPIIVYPLIITDAMETSSVGRSIEVMRQAALSLSGVVSNIGLNAGAGGASDRLDALLGADRNSLVTVGRVNDHTLRIRIGAQQQGSRLLALVPRTQNVSVVVFTRVGQDRDKYLDRLTVITDATFLDVDSGMGVPSERNFEARPVLREKVKKLVDDYGFQWNRAQCPGDDAPLELLRALDRGNYSRITECVLPKSAKQPPVDEKPQAAWHPSSSEQASLRRLIASLMTLQTDSRHSTLAIPLSPYRSRAFMPPEARQLVLLSDDPSAGAKATLRGGENLDKDRMKSRLKLVQNGKELVLLPTAIDVDPGATSVTLAFPSIAGSNLAAASTPAGNKKSAPKAAAPSMNLELRFASEDKPEEFGSPQAYEVRLVPATPKPMPNPVTVTSGVLVADTAGTAQLKLIVGEWDAKKQGKLALRVSGADVRAIDPAAPIDATRKAVPLAGTSVVTLTLGNLSPAHPIQLQTIADKEAVGVPLTLMVEAPRSAAR